MRDWKYNKDRTAVLVNELPKQKLKITGTRFATILGFNAWQGSFTAWCEITKLAKVPFEGSIYTEAGKAIEPKVLDFLKAEHKLPVKTPEEYYGNRYSSMKYDFFPEEKVFGGMWDGIITKTDGIAPRACVEVKTTKRAEDWADGPPLYYLAQACLYPYLMGIDDFFLTVTFLKDDDYNHPENFKVTNDNTKVFPFKVSEVRFPLNDTEYTFEQLVGYAKEWYDYFVMGYESPEFDEKADRDILEILRKSKPANDTNLDDIIAKIAELEDAPEYAMATAIVKRIEGEIKALKEGLKSSLVEQMGETDTAIAYGGWTVTKSKPSVKADIDALIRDGMLQYLSETEGTLTLRKSKE